MQADTANSSPPATTACLKAYYIAAGCLLAISVYMQYSNGRAGDKDWQLLATQMWLQGKTIYETAYFDINSPLVNYIYALPVYLSLHTGLPDSIFLVTLGLCVTLFSVALCTRLIRSSAAGASPTSQQQFTLLLCFIFIFFTNPAYFFHREQIFLILVFPYIIRWMPSAEDQPLSITLKILTGCMAGIGFCMKPHCMVVWGAMQAILVYRHRSLRVLYSLENLAVYGLNVLYAISILLLAPNYLFVVLPMALESYSAYNYKENAIFYLSLAGLMLGVTFADFRLRDTSPLRKDIFYLLEICLCFVLYALLNNGWGYTYNPVFSIIFLILGFVLREYIYLKHKYEKNGLPAARFNYGIRACTLNFAVNVVLVLALYYQSATYRCEGTGAACNMQNALLLELKAPDHIRSFGSISMEFMPWVELSRQGAPWKTRFHHLWMLPGFFAASPQYVASHHWITDYVSAGLAEDLNTNKPEVVFVDDTDDFITIHQHIDLVQYLSAHTDFRLAWRLYRYLHTIDMCPKTPDGIEIKKRCSYRVYRRAASETLNQ